MSSVSSDATRTSQQLASPDSRDRYEKAAAIMLAFAERTGLTSQRPERRYLWTDAFAVCNYLGLARATGQAQYAELALKLVEHVHHSLGRHRPDDPRTGWISGLDGQQGEAHPTQGGLRIGKQLAERKPDEPLDVELEWERDGQYFHYLTKWMHALDQATRSTGQPVFNVWARELAQTAHRAFVYPISGGGRRMYWKMSIDLSYPLVRSMGQHDALDGYVTGAQLCATASGIGGAVGRPVLDEIAADFESMIDRGGLETADPLGLGGLLADGYRLAQLADQGASVDVRLKDDLLEAALAGLEHYARRGDLDEGAERRLAFRELGLAIGLHAVAAMRQQAAGDRALTREGRAVLEKLGAFDPLRAKILAFWLEPEHQRASTWTKNRDINDVMLATALAPDGFLVVRPMAHEQP
jgi:hypothetical protein